MNRSSSGGLAQWYINLTDFDIGRELGSGAFGKVHLGTRRSDNLAVAIKTIEQFSNEAEQKCFIREITIPAQLNDPAIVPLIGFSLPMNSGPVIVTKFISNGSLEDVAEHFMKHKILPPRFTPINFVINFYGIAHALSVLHKRQILHRDLKPANILLGDRFEPYLADFGLSRVSDSINKTGNVGSPLFMAPELYNPDGEYEAPVDIYAFGMMLFWLLRQDLSLMFDDGAVVKNPTMLSRKIMMSRRPARVRGINDAYWTLITDCWAQSPGDRPAAEDICSRLEGEEFMLEPAKEAEFREYVEMIKRHERELQERTAGATRNGRSIQASGGAGQVRRFQFGRRDSGHQ